MTEHPAAIDVHAESSVDGIVKQSLAPLDIDDISVGQVGSRANKATSTENKGSFQDWALFDGGALVPGNFAFDYEVLAHEQSYLLMDDHG
jgi:hypothetical protein